MNLPRITVIIPSFNQAQYIEESIQSILDQNYPNLEFMILDGGSTDGSPAIIERYADDLTYWHSKPDKGQTDALIQGFERATGEILGWVNSDDVLFPNALHNIARAYIKHPHGGIFAGNYVLIDQDGRIIRCKCHPKQSGWFGRHGMQVVSPDWFFTRDAYNKVGGLDRNIEYSMDLDLYMKMIMEGIHYVCIDAELMGFRIHPASKTMANEKENLDVERLVSFWLKEKYGLWYNAPWIWWSYRLLQILNGNYIRMALKSLRVQGRYWQDYVKGTDA